MTDAIPIFFLEPTDRERRWLRRYSVADKKTCGKHSDRGCDARFEIGEADIRYTADGYIDATKRGDIAGDDPRWPTHCQACGRGFTDHDEHQLFTQQIYVRPDTGFRCTLPDAPVGAVWNAWWIADRREGVAPGAGSMIGPDGRCLIVRLPGGHDWMIDGRASNCTMKDDNNHHCWVRHGNPEDGTLHVDKNGKTCAAGAGSIDTGKWHGFLHHGKLHT